jgi:hypothetical protein
MGDAPGLVDLLEYRQELQIHVHAQTVSFIR